MQNPLVSIVIPTKNRYKYLKQLILLINSFKLKELELIIQDNSIDNSEFLDFFYSTKLENIYYYYNKESLSVVENANMAILNSRGKYVCFIGDDDGILKNIVDVVKFMEVNNIDALISSPIIYNWPDYVDSSIFKLSGVILYKKFTNRAKILDAKKEFRKITRTGFSNITCMPKVYQGIVSRACLDKIYFRGKTFFPGPSPDMANSVALAFTVDNFCYLDAPLIITGQCYSVGGGERLCKRGVKQIEDVTFLPKNTICEWDNRIPRLWCSDTIWPESAIKAMSYMNVDSSKYVNENYILAKFIFNHPFYFKTNIFKCNMTVIKRIKIISLMIGLLIKKTHLFCMNRIVYIISNRKKVGRQYIIRDVYDINNVSEFFRYFIDAKIYK